ncbi:MAG: serine/threonine-protein kinase, partial [Myxococcales bacterium]|nr:serine/threonine protein kinase [Polyangiaceae bacterium]MDW8252032.1 serine/threonine-protein kinase [Myxococcales bacterium]
MSLPRSARVSLPASTPRYRLEERVGGGGMGEIFRAIDQSTGEPVAIKLLRTGVSPHEEARFQREVKVLADLRHPNVVRYIDHGVWPGGRPFLAMEWLEGEDLAARHKREPLGMRDAVEAIRRASAALAAVHARGVVHRDIKLANLWLCGGRIQRVKLIDFGVVKLPEDDGFTTQPGAIVGTPFHMAPEQARNEPITPRSDVYSLGSVLFLLLTGRLVFPSEHLVALLGHLVLEDAPRISSLRPDVPEALDHLVARCLDRDASARYQDGGELARALARVGDLPNTPPPLQTVRGTGRPNTSSGSIRIAQERPSPSHASEQRPSRPLRAATGRRLVAVVLASLEQGLLPKELRRSLQGVMTGSDHVEPIRGERLVLVMGLASSKGDEALRAAQAALLIYRMAPGARVTLASGYVRETERGLSSETLERAALLLEHTAPGEVRIDRETAPLLGTR